MAAAANVNQMLSFVFRAAGDAEVVGASNRITKSLNTVGSSWKTMQRSISKASQYMRFLGMGGAFAGLQGMLGGDRAQSDNRSFVGDLAQMITAFAVFEKITANRRRIAVNAKLLSRRLGAAATTAAAVASKSLFKVVGRAVGFAVKKGLSVVLGAVGTLFGGPVGTAIGIAVGIVVGELLGNWIGKAVDWLWEKAKQFTGWVWGGVKDSWKWLWNKLAVWFNRPDWASTLFDPEQALRQILPEERNRFFGDAAEQMRNDGRGSLVSDQFTRFVEVYREEMDANRRTIQTLIDTMEFERRN